MKARFTKWGPIVYSAVGPAADFRASIVRMALHPVLDNEPSGDGPPFPCRVVWDERDSVGMRWSSSCRGRDTLSGVLGADAITHKGPALHASPWAGAGEDEDGNAIKWLIDGERRGTREQRRRTKAKG